MKIKVKRLFRFQKTPTKVGEVKPGVYSVPGDLSNELAAKILKFGKAEKLIDEKKAPENKNLGKAPESKSKVAKKTGNRRGTGAKSDA